MNETEFASVGQLLKQLIANSPHKHKLEEAKIVCSWRQVMPPAIVKKTERIVVKRDKVFIKLSSSPLRHELHNSKTQVIQQLKEAAPECTIVDIIFS